MIFRFHFVSWLCTKTFVIIFDTKAKQWSIWRCSSLQNQAFLTQTWRSSKHWPRNKLDVLINGFFTFHCEWKMHCDCRNNPAKNWFLMRKPNNVFFWSNQQCNNRMSQKLEQILTKNDWARKGKLCGTRCNSLRKVCFKKWMKFAIVLRDTL